MNQGTALRYVRDYLTGQIYPVILILLVGFLANLVTLFIPLLLAQTLEISYARTSTKSAFWQALGLGQTMELSTIIVFM
ncbi:MAG: hypothetical protein AAF598_21585, partial [Bacteroidota bacterium]